MYFFDNTMFLLIPALILTMYAQMKVNSAYRKYSDQPNRRGLTGVQAARMILDRSGLSQVPIELTPGHLSDHYDPRTKVLRLSADNANQATVAAVSIAAHEAGHAVQDKERYAALRLRNSFAPVAAFSSQLSWLFLCGGLFLGYIGTSYWYWGPLLFDIGILLYTAVVLFQLITLPVEFDASRRAMVLLDSCGILQLDESAGARKMLSAAALTYVAAMASALLTLIRLLWIRDRS
jgi:Zn-dependent membrane protease YugP